MHWFTNRRKEHLARTLLDLGKVSMGVLVINQFITDARLRIPTMVLGAAISIICFFTALAIDDTKT